MSGSSISWAICKSAHLDCPGQNPESRKMVVVVVVVVVVSVVNILSFLLLFVYIICHI